LLGAIGAAKSYDIWIPLNDRERLDWSIMNQFDCRQVLPHGTESAGEALQEIDREFCGGVILAVIPLV